MRPRLMLCPRRTIETAGFNEIKHSGRYNILRTIGKNSDVDLSGYSEIILLYQYPLKETNEEFLNFVRKNQDSLKNATLVFDIPMEIIEETGLGQSKECMMAICKDVFDDITTISLHATSRTDVPAHTISDEIDMNIVTNKGWEKESGHAALLTTYYFPEIGLKVKKICKFEILIGVILAAVGLILAILETAKVISSDLMMLYGTMICFGAIAAITGCNEKLKDNWRR